MAAPSPAFIVVSPPPLQATAFPFRVLPLPAVALVRTARVIPETAPAEIPVPEIAARRER